MCISYDSMMVYLINIIFHGSIVQTQHWNNSPCSFPKHFLKRNDVLQAIGCQLNESPMHYLFDSRTSYRYTVTIRLSVHFDSNIGIEILNMLKCLVEWVFHHSYINLNVKIPWSIIVFQGFVLDRIVGYTSLMLGHLYLLNPLGEIVVDLWFLIL